MQANACLKSSVQLDAACERTTNWGDSMRVRWALRYETGRSISEALVGRLGQGEHDQLLGLLTRFTYPQRDADP